MIVDLPFSTLVWQPRPATWLATIACKVTFTLQPNELTLARAQDAITLHDAFWDDDPSRSLAVASDVVPTRPKADVLVVGSAFAPAGQAVRSLVARVVFESIDKSIEIVADRAVGPDGTVFQGERFSRMPLVYERAAGGPGTWNPVGVATGSWDADGRAQLPNITPVGKGDMTLSMPEPIGFGPIAASWPGRADLLGAHASLFDAEGWQADPLPEGVDMGYFNAAPPDQQIDAIPDEAALLLEGLHPGRSVLGCKLPGIRPRVTVERRGEKERPAMRADSLLIDTDREIVVVTWRGHVTLDRPQESLRVSAEAERPRNSWRTIPHITSRGTLSNEATIDGAMAIPPLERSPASTSGPGRVVGAALPFQNIARATERRASDRALPFAKDATVAAAAPVFAPEAPAPVPPRIGFGQPSAEAWPAPAASAVALPPPAAGAIAVPPPAVLTHASSAGFGGVVSASNAAADPRLQGGYTELGARRVEGDVLQLLWFMPEAAKRVRRKPAWKKILDQLPPAAFDPEVDDPSAEADREDLEDKREIYEVIARGTPGGQDCIDGALLDEARSDGRFAAQLLLLRGEAHFDFDEIERLKATVSAVAPFAADDEALTRAVALSAKLLAAPGLVTSPDVVNGVTARVHEAFKRVSRPVPATYLEDQTERALLERRAYQKRAVFGEPHLRGQFFFGSGSTGVPIYFPAKVAEKLPQLRRVLLRALCEAHFQADQYESHHAALRCAAVARIVR